MSPRDDGSDQKFKIGQHVIVKGVIVNGERRDFGGHVKQYMTRGDKLGQVEVVLNSTHLIFPEDRLMDYVQYWNEKNKGEV